MNLSPNEKIAGILAPLFALRTDDDWGIGEVSALKQLVDWAASNGFKLIQLLPINETGRDNSPYNAISAVAIEPTTLCIAPGSPPDLTQEDCDAVMSQIEKKTLRRGNVNYRRVRKLNGALLEMAFTHFEEKRAVNPKHSQAFEDFCQAEAKWLEDYALFRALMEKNGGREKWDAWPDEHSSLGAARSWLERIGPARRKKFETRMRFFRYVQWIAYEQWSGVRRHAEERGVALMGDVPFGVSYYSADVFAQPNEFVLDWSGGAPPEPYFKDDEFTQKWGQNWGIPLYRWNVMRGNNFQWWRERVRATRRIFHLFRIDHVQGFYRVYAFPWRPERNKEFLPLDQQQMLEQTGGRAPHFVPRADDTPEHREANKREGEEYLRAIMDEAGAARVAGEDLGVVPDYVRPSLQTLGIAGFKIPQWEIRDGLIIPGEMYERLSVATYATHDHEPIRALWEQAFEQPNSETGQQARATLEKIALFAGVNPKNDGLYFEKDFYPAMMDALFRCNSWILIVMITDLLARKYRFNVPGTRANLNWTRRIQRSITKLRSSRKERNRTQLIHELLEKTGRV